ncbi:MAG: 4-(cytidine 5'-diphospho)-2-C-methyl-D-erythritol kinase, partial [Xanthobacteraceae bacterium]
MPVPLVEKAPAKVNLTLRVLGRRPDGYHEIVSLVVFGDFADRLTLTPGGELVLSVGGPRAADAGSVADNLVLKAARALASRLPGMILGTIDLE